MSKVESKSLIKKDSAFLQKVGNQIAITNKLLNEFLEKEKEEIVKGKKDRDVKSFPTKIEYQKILIKKGFEKIFKKDS